MNRFECSSDGCFQVFKFPAELFFGCCRLLILFDQFFKIRCSGLELGSRQVPGQALDVVSQTVGLFLIPGSQRIPDIGSDIGVFGTKIQQQFAVKLLIALQPVEPLGQLKPRQGVR